MSLLLGLCELLVWEAGLPQSAWCQCGVWRVAWAPSWLEGGLGEWGGCARGICLGIVSIAGGRTTELGLFDPLGY